jgi:hypothetical protein
VVLVIRGTSQQFKFSIPYNYEDLTDVRIAFWQEDNHGTEDYTLPIIKTKNDCTSNPFGTILYVTLNSKESLAFATDRKAFVQMRATTIDGFTFGCRKKSFTVHTINEELLPDEEV